MTSRCVNNNKRIQQYDNSNISRWLYNTWFGKFALIFRMSVTWNGQPFDFVQFEGHPNSRSDLVQATGNFLFCFRTFVLFSFFVLFFVFTFLTKSFDKRFFWTTQPVTEMSNEWTIKGAFTLRIDWSRGGVSSNILGILWFFKLQKILQRTKFKETWFPTFSNWTKPTSYWPLLSYPMNEMNDANFTMFRWFTELLPNERLKKEEEKLNENLKIDNSIDSPFSSQLAAVSLAWNRFLMQDLCVCVFERSNTTNSLFWNSCWFIFHFIFRSFGFISSWFLVEKSLHNIIVVVESDCVSLRSNNEPISDQQ